MIPLPYSSGNGTGCDFRVFVNYIVLPSCQAYTIFPNTLQLILQINISIVIKYGKIHTPSAECRWMSSTPIIGPHTVAGGIAQLESTVPTN